MLKIQENQLSRLIASSRFNFSYNCTFSELWATATRAEDKTAKLTINIAVKFPNWSKAKYLTKIHTGLLSQSPEKFISDGLELFLQELDIFLQDRADAEDDLESADLIANLYDKLL